MRDNALTPLNKCVAETIRAAHKRVDMNMSLRLRAEAQIPVICGGVFIGTDWNIFNPKTMALENNGYEE